MKDVSVPGATRIRLSLYFEMTCVCLIRPPIFLICQSFGLVCIFEEPFL